MGQKYPLSVHRDLSMQARFSDAQSCIDKMALEEIDDVSGGSFAPAKTIRVVSSNQVLAR